MAFSWASLAGPALDFAAGLLGGGSSGASKEARHIQYDTWQMNKDMAYNGVQRRVEDAKKAGVNPVVALGMNPYQGSVAQFAGDINSRSIAGDLARAGSDISRSIAASQDRESRALTKITSRQMIEKNQAEIDLLNSQRRQIDSQIAPAVPTNVSKVKAALADLPTPLGYDDGLEGWERLTYDQKGNPMAVLNNDVVGDNEFIQAGHALIRTVPQFFWNNFGGRKLTDALIRHRIRTKGRPYIYPWPKGYYK